jgi:DNA-3-methyladenine glycosylase I
MDFNKTPNIKEIFIEIERTLYNQSQFDFKELTEALRPYKEINKDVRNDYEYFWTMVCVTFYSGFKAITVENKLEGIKEILGDLDRIAKLDISDVDKIISTNKVINNKQKIAGIIQNAKEFKRIQAKYGSFHKYLHSFGDLENDTNLKLLIIQLKKRIKYLGPITIYHFLTDIGINVLKPDRVICRLFNRLELIKNQDQFFCADEYLWNVVMKGREIAQSTGLPIRYIDIVLVIYGQVGKKSTFNISNGICLEKNPKCNLCGVNKYCDYSNKQN